MSRPAASVMALATALARIAVTALLASIVAILIAELAPGSPGERAARAAGVLPADDSAIPAPLRADLVARVAAAHGLNAPLAVRVVQQTGRLVRGDFGRSWRTGEPVRGPLARAGARSALLVALALVVAILLGVGAAFAAQLARRRLAQVLVAASVSVVLATPPVWIALLLLRALGDSVAMPLAIVSLAALPAALISGHARAALCASLAAPHAVAARARGVSERRLVVVHASREVAATLLALLPGLVGYSIGASMVIEKVFGIRGFGAALADGAASGDAPVVVAAVASSAALVAAAAVISRALRRRCDPRLAEGAS